ncbi:Uma2 family endonuclease [Tundrisphaera lichenicola]|uniref:Uma2 family endonuclease n=1 Tax=Tundrisphaera lichenicola TaxID=2029860 RepID=UPI003EB7EEB8
MATATQTRYTPEDLLTIQDRPMPELVDGQLLEREMGQRSDSIAATFLILLGVFVREHGLGLVNGAQGSYQIFPDEPNKVRIPDASFTRKERVPAGGPFEGHGKIAPDLVIEVTSPNDTHLTVQAKVNDYLAAGVPLIWVAEPETKTVQVFRRNHTGVLLFVGDVLDGEEILPGFRCEVASLFA